MLRIIKYLTCIYSLTSFSQCDLYIFDNDNIYIYPVDCGSDSTGSFQFATLGGEGTDYYTINLDGDIIYAGFENEFENLVAGNYIITVEDEAGCLIDTNIVIISSPNPYFHEDESSTGYNPAYCRASGDISGNGVVYADGSSLLGSITYLWENLTTGETTDNSTWGGRNPGDYQITITDENGCTAKRIITVDSINPIASFNIISDDIWEIPYGYAGNAPVYIKCHNTSTGYANPIDPASETDDFFRWHVGNYAEWITTGLDYEPEVTFSFENVWGIKLVVETPGGCLDTSHQFIAVFGPLSNAVNSEIRTIFVNPNSNDKTLKFTKTGFDNSKIRVFIYDISGNLLVESDLEEYETTLFFNMPKGTYIYKFIEESNSQIILTGKFVY
jgi:hypothetical protein